MKKAQMFSLISLLMSALFIGLFTGFSHVPLDKDVSSVQAQVNRLNILVDSFDYIVDTAIDRSTYEILKTTVDRFDMNDPYADYVQTFEECMINGSSVFVSLGPNPVPCHEGNPTGASLNEKLNATFQIAESLYGVDLHHEVLYVSMEQYTPYSLLINTTVRIRLEFDDIEWDRVIVRSREVSFVGITDPQTKGKLFERPIKYRPSPLGEIFRSTSFGGDIGLIREYIDEGYYFRDYTGLSFIDILNGEHLTNLTEHHRLGIGSFLPLTASGNDLYKQYTPMVLQYYVNNFELTNCDALRRFNESETSIPTSLLFPKEYVINTLGVNGTLAEALQNVCAGFIPCCDASGCDPTCG